MALEITKLCTLVTQLIFPCLHYYILHITMYLACFQSSSLLVLMLHDHRSIREFTIIVYFVGPRLSKAHVLILGTFPSHSQSSG